jgi:chorismate mutase/prephenate dehydratase
MKDIDELRLEINKIDEKMAKLFIERMKVVEGIARYKKSVGMDILDSSREKEVIEKNSRRVEGELAKKYYIRFLEDNMKRSREFQKEVLNGMSDNEKE